MKLLSQNSKLKKNSASMGWLAYGLQLAPHKVSGYNVCSHASAGCSAACLFTSGRGKMGSVKHARVNKTKRLFEDKENFLSDLFKDITALVRKAKKNGLQPCIRLNTISDLPWENIKYNGQSMMAHFPNVQFYDYTKNFDRVIYWLDGGMPDNYHLTFSRSESNGANAASLLKSGANVAFVFSDALPPEYGGFKVIDGDHSDLRFLDPKNCIVGLVAKGDGKRDTSGFVIHP